MNINHVFHFVIAEIIKIIPAIIYFLIAFNLIFFTTGLMEYKGEVRYFSYLTVSLSALLVGKMLLIVNSFPFINAFPRRPLIYNIVWKFLLYSISIFILWSLDTFVRLLFKYKDLSLAANIFLVELHNPAVWSALLWLMMVFLVFVIFTEFLAAIGRQKVLHLLLKESPDTCHK